MSQYCLLPEHEVMPKPKEISWTCEDGIRIAGKRWSSVINKHDNDNDNNQLKSSLSVIKVIALHGWMDNCATFDVLAPRLRNKIVDVDFVAIDLPGHGQSSHKSLDGTTCVLAENCYYVYDIVVQLGWRHQDVTIVGHSMGASIALMFAAAFSVKRLIILDSLGPQSKKKESISRCIREHIKARTNGKMTSSVYPNLEQAVKARCKSPKMFPGKQYISESTARALVQRGSVIEDNGQLRFLHDQRLYWPSILFLSEEQIEVLYKDVAANQSTSTCLLLAKDGMPFPSEMINRARKLLLIKSNDTYQQLPGSHHFHSDPDSVDKVVNAIAMWLYRQN